MSINQNMNQRVTVDIDINELSRDLSAAVLKVKEIQKLAKSFIDAIVVQNDETEKETQVIKTTITKVRNVRVELDELGNKYSKLRLNNIHEIPLGNTGYVSLDPKEEHNGFYKQLLDCYTWLSNIDKDATRVLRQLEEEETRSILRKKEESPAPNLKEMIASIKSAFPNMVFNDSLVVPECCLVVTVGKAFVINIAFSGMVPSHVMAKSMREVFTLKPWEHSEHIVFQTLSDIFTSKILKYSHLNAKDLLHALLTFINSYKDIFSTKCHICGKYMRSVSQNSPILPPVVRNPTGSFSHLCCE